MAALTINKRGGFSTLRGLWTLPLDQEDDVASASSPSFNDDDGSYDWASCAGEDKYSVLLRPVSFNANVDPAFYAPRAVDEDKERRLVNKNKLWFDKAIAGRDKDKQTIERGGGRGNGTKQHATRQMQEDRSIDMH